jgi:hypothetical protein
MERPGYIRWLEVSNVGRPGGAILGRFKATGELRPLSTSLCFGVGFLEHVGGRSIALMHVPEHGGVWKV